MTRPSDAVSRVFESRFRVRSYELDGFGHVNHAVFFNWFEQARFECLSQGGLDPTLLAERGWAVVVVHAEADFRKEVRLGDEVTVRSWVTATKKTSMVLHHDVVREEGSAILAEGSVVVVWLDADAGPIRIPDAVRKAFELEEPSS